MLYTLLLLVATKHFFTIAEEIPACCPIGGVWSEWVTTGACTTTCGSCNTAPRSRTCTSESEGCPCTGLAEDVGPCGISMCSFPTRTCCDPHVKRLNNNTKSFFCGTESVPATPTWSCASTVNPIPSCCPTGGVWSEWITTEACPTTCGSCSSTTRTRTCTSESAGCPCTGSATDIGPCGVALCSFPSRTCCNPHAKRLNNNTKSFFCGTESVPTTPAWSCTTPTACCPEGGLWSEWVTTGVCATQCGSCSNATRTRTCISESAECPCMGSATESGPCGTALCSFPIRTCCDPYVKSVNHNTKGFFCGLESVPVTSCASAAPSVATLTIFHYIALILFETSVY